MEIENFSINCSEDVLEFEVVVEGLLVTVESRQSRANISVRRKQGFKDIPMMACELVAR
jgi:hypothetical protein